MAPLKHAGPDFRDTKISARPGSEFIYTKIAARPGFQPGGDEGDVDENADFQREKMALQSPLFSILTKSWLKFRGNGSKN